MKIQADIWQNLLMRVWFPCLKTINILINLFRYQNKDFPCNISNFMTFCVEFKFHIEN